MQIFRVVDILNLKILNVPSDNTREVNSLPSSLSNLITNLFSEISSVIATLVKLGNRLFSSMEISFKTNSSSLEFGNVEVNFSSDTLSVIVSNYGNEIYSS